MSRGFTLLEVLVTLTVAAVCLSAIARLAGGAVHAGVRAAHRVAALALAEDLLSRRSAADGGAASGTTAEGYAWRVSVADYAAASPPYAKGWRPEAVQLEVLDPGGGRWTLETIRLARTTPQ